MTAVGQAHLFLQNTRYADFFKLMKLNVKEKFIASDLIKDYVYGIIDPLYHSRLENFLTAYKDEILKRLPKQQQTTAPFLCMQANELAYEDVDYHRAMYKANAYWKGFYFERPEIDEAIQKSIKAKKYCLLSGDSLAGKTYAVVHNVQKFDSKWQVVVSQKMFWNEQTTLPNITPNTVILIDHVEEYMQNALHFQIFNNLLDLAQKACCAVIAICCDGNERELFNQQASREAWLRKIAQHEIWIPPYEKQERKQVSLQVQAKIQQIFEKDYDEKDFDFDMFEQEGNLGIMFMPLTDLEHRYKLIKHKNLPTYDTQVQKDAEIILLVLFSLAEAYAYKGTKYNFDATYIYEIVSKIYEKQIDLYCMLMGKYVREEGLPTDKTQPKEFTFIAYRQALELLKDGMQEKLPFLYIGNIHKRLTIKIDYVYLKYIIRKEFIEKKINIKKQVENVLYNVCNHDIGEIIKYGFFYLVIKHALDIQKIMLYEEALEHFYKGFQYNIYPNTIIYNILIKKTTKYEEAKRLLNEMMLNDLYPNEITYNLLISHKDISYQEAEILFKEIPTKGLQINEIHYNSLMAHKNISYKKAMALFEEMTVEKGLKATEYHYNTLLSNKEISYEESIRLFEEMPTKGLFQNDLIYNTLIANKNINYLESKKLFEEMLNNGLKHNKAHYSTLLLNKNINYKEAKRLFNEMIERGFILNTTDYNVLIGHRNAVYEDVMQLFEDMKDKGVSPNSLTYNTIMMRKELSYEEVKKLFEEMIEKNIFINEMTYNILISHKDVSYIEAKRLFNEMIEKEIQPNEYNYNSLLANKEANYEDTKELFTKILEMNIKNIKVSYNILLKHKDIDLEELKSVFSKMIENGLEPDEYTYFAIFNHKDIKYIDIEYYFNDLKSRGLTLYKSHCEIILKKNFMSFNNSKIYFDEVISNNINKKIILNSFAFKNEKSKVFKYLYENCIDFFYDNVFEHINYLNNFNSLRDFYTNFCDVIQYNYYNENSVYFYDLLIRNMLQKCIVMKMHNYNTKKNISIVSDIINNNPYFLSDKTKEIYKNMLNKYV